MVICPLCEHPQEFGLECEQCGRDLSGLAGLDGLAPPPPNLVSVEGLEVTVPQRVGEVAVEQMPELEGTRFGTVQVAVEVSPELETGRAADVGAVAVEPLPDFSLDRAPDDGTRAAAPSGAQRCRYCGHTQAAVTAACEKCGMRLPRVGEAPVAAAKVAQVKTRCRACGAPATAGSHCGDCGREVPFPDA